MKSIICFCLIFGAIIELIILNVCAGVEVKAGGLRKRLKRSAISRARAAAKRASATQRAKTNRQNPPGTRKAIEELCDKDDDCASGFCCPSVNIPKGETGKTCRYLDCCSPLGNCTEAEPGFSTFIFKNKQYKLFINEPKSWLSAMEKCCDWKKGGSLAVIDGDDLYTFVENQIFQAMNVEQRKIKHGSELDITVYIDGTDIDNEGTYVSVFSGGQNGAPIDSKYFSSPLEPVASKSLNCVGIRYWDATYGQFKMSTFDCRRLEPFLCEAPK